MTNQQAALAEAHTSALTSDDARIVRRIVAGDLAAFELLMRRHNRRLYRLARATLRNDAEAEDALQDAYLKAFRALAQFRGDAALATWLSHLVLNECLARKRREARRHNVMPIVPDCLDEEQMAFDMDPMHTRDDSSPEQQVSRAEIRALLERKLDTLPVGFRTVFVLRTVEEMSIEETAQVLNIPEATVRSRHFRARNLLREALAEEVDRLGPELFEFGGGCCDRIVAAVLARLGRT
ncbi:RNA polymerase sigma factor [Paraburkholderia nodosa]|uniref:RNA polymerase sigma factor n=1 Tax=Paraburkholderia nodosa TaxID=392320 RepID=UPI0004B4E119|nr:RNA polymerase sigma factor [Paraburkholderia nodosa]